MSAPVRALRRAVATAALAVFVLPAAGCFTAMLWNPHEFGRGEVEARTKARAVVDDGVTVPLTPAVRDALGDALPPEAAAAAALRFEALSAGSPPVRALLAGAPPSPDPVLELRIAPDRAITGVLSAGTAAVPGRVESLASLRDGVEPEQPIALAARRRFRPSSSLTRAAVTPLTVALDVVTSPIQLLAVLLRR